MVKVLKKNLFLKYFFLLLIISYNFGEILKAEEKYISNNQFSAIENRSSKGIIKTEYILGSGDVIALVIDGLPRFNGLYPINLDGQLILPEIKKFDASGLTLNELEEALTNEYRKYIYDPYITLILEKRRDLNIFIAGEVRNPGLYKINVDLNRQSEINPDLNAMSNDYSTLDEYEFSPISNPLRSELALSQMPKIFDIIKISGGVSNNADLTKVKIIREDSKSNGYGHLTANVNFLEFILKGDQSFNIDLRDGDTIEIPKSEKVIKEQVIAINKTNINPNSILVYITGNVVSQGEKVVRKGTSLNQAISASGGKKLLSGKIEFIRFNADGLTKRDLISYEPNAKINSFNNPILMDGDIINIRKTVIGNMTSILQEVSTPLLTGYGIYSIFEP